MRFLGSLAVAIALLQLAGTPPAAAEEGGRLERNLTVAQRPGTRLPPIAADALTVETRMLAVTIDGSAYRLHAVTVTPPGSAPFPLAVISHGTPRDPTKRRETSPRSYLAIAEDFARRGYKAVAFVRRGYGESSGSYVETVGVCSAEGYARSARLAAADYIGVIEAMRADASVDGRAVVAVGQSTGGLAVTALAGLAPKGLLAVVNFAGGRGSTKDFTICNEAGLTGAFGLLGRTAAVPALWLYSTADRFFWPELVHRNLDAYAENGAAARLEMVGPLWFSDDGHDLFDLGGRMLWRPRIDAFLAAVGAPSWTGDPGDAAVARHPAPEGLSEKWHQRWLRYLGATGHKAFAVGPSSRFGWAARRETAAAAAADALEFCQSKGDRCRVASIDGAAAD